ncbi:hypothetical protein F2Q68_00020049 [Brassica cretica]|uniref:Uncharacterized protein n=2 Tax=Brassica cretica TaxID=69181 RepID=A0A8S9FTN7_BRACR|nr:hypothetical protein F2Q68_00020049 [Brassica cretica]KAF3562275.1 hypothetical protein DY000_02013335 [Brassica cretica]
METCNRNQTIKHQGVHTIGLFKGYILSRLLAVRVASELKLRSGRVELAEIVSRERAEYRVANELRIGNANELKLGSSRAGTSWIVCRELRSGREQGSG